MHEMVVNSAIALPRINRVLLTCLLLSSAMAVVLHFFKVSHLDDYYGTFYFYITFPLALVLTIACLIRFRPSAFVEPTYCILLLVMIVMGGVGAVHYGAGLIDVSGDVIRLLFCLLFVVASTNRPQGYVTYVNSIIPHYSKLFLAVSLVAVAMLYFLSGRGGSVYFGLQVTVALLPLAYGLVFKKKWFVVFSIVAIALAGKRGTMLAAVIVILASVVIDRRPKVILKMAVGVALILVMTLTTIHLNLIPEQVTKRFSEFQNTDTFDANRATAGRIHEIDAALDEFKSNQWILIFGKGLGGAYEIDNASDSTVHISPFSMILRFGIPATFLFYLYLVRILVRPAHERVTENGLSYQWYKVIFLFFAGEFAFSFSAFTLLQSYELWIAYCYLINFGLLRKSKI